ncbi:MAG TPA: hypothetical protein PKN33_13760 [Phycisphaerae bacterium]|nr:hypothetical protein [Phycisphaerae bacterium]
MPSPFSKLTLRLMSALLIVAIGRSAAADEPSALETLRAEHPSVKVRYHESRIERLYSGPLSTGSSAMESAEAFRTDHADVFGTAPGDLVLDRSGVRDPEQPLMYDRRTGEFRFSLITYRQFKQYVPVFRSELRLVLRNEASFPMVLASSTLKDLGEFEIDPATLSALSNPSMIAASFVKGRASAISEVNELAEFGTPAVTIWAGTDDTPNEIPRPALVFEGADSMSNDQVNSKWLFVTDFQSGKIHYRENQLLDGAVTGTVKGWALGGVASEFCESEYLHELSYAEVSIPQMTTHTDIFGDYFLDAGAASSVQVQSPTRGLYFNVMNHSGTTVLSQTVSPPAVADFTHNLVPSSINRAEVNAYYYANKIRDYVLDANPAYPVIGSQTAFQISVNEPANGLCPGNAQYTGVGLRFCAAGSGFPNTAWSNLIYHEYGHHIVESSGSGQGQYGEGVADSISVLLLDDPRSGLGLATSCQTATRTADNAFMYPCSNIDPHVCGNVLSGCIWDTRQELAVTEPADALQIVGDLLVNSVLLHAGSSITPAITIDFLTLDDDDADIGNGTPHSAEILAGFGAHNMAPLAPPANDKCIDAITICPGVTFGSTLGSLPDGSSTCAQSNPASDVWFRYAPQTSGNAFVSLCDSGTDYDSAISIHTGCPGQVYDEVACDDDGCGTVFGPSQASFAVSAGEEYYLRVTGYLGAVGSFELELSGPACEVETPEALQIRFPKGRPANVAPNSPKTLMVEIKPGTEQLVPGTVMLHHRDDGGTFQSIPMTGIGGGLFEVALPGSNCSAALDYYVSAAGDGSTITKSPSAAPADVYSAFVGVSTTLFEDDFETDKGWTVSGFVFEGDWERGVPVNNNRGDPDSDYDGSGQCYLTENDPFDSNSDVDAGTTILTSPVFDMNTGGVISYAYWIDSGPGSFDEDYLLTEIATDPAGTNWTPVRVHTIAQPIWKTDAILIGTEVPASSTVRIRFSASDLSVGTIVECAIDAVRVETYTCDNSASCVDGVLNQGEERIDCGGSCDPCECTIDVECEDGLFCSGARACNAYGTCESVSLPCGEGTWCRESDDQCLPYGNGDFDSDGDVDLKDFALFQLCFGAVPEGACEPGNLSGDASIDSQDFAVFATILVAPLNE